MITFIIVWWCILGMLAARVVWVSEAFERTTKAHFIGIAVFTAIFMLLGVVGLIMTLDNIPNKDYKFW